MAQQCPLKMVAPIMQTGTTVPRAPMRLLQRQQRPQLHLKQDAIPRFHKPLKWELCSCLNSPSPSSNSSSNSSRHSSNNNSINNNRFCSRTLSSYPLNSKCNRCSFFNSSNSRRKRFRLSSNSSNNSSSRTTCDSSSCSNIKLCWFSVNRSR